MSSSGLSVYLRKSWFNVPFSYEPNYLIAKLKSDRSRVLLDS